MAEYIEREALFRSIAGDVAPFNVAMVFRHIHNAPAADVVPVVHGRWVSVPYKLARVCSVCNRDEPYKFADIDADVYDYCPYCGAKMDGGDNSETD